MSSWLQLVLQEAVMMNAKRHGLFLSLPCQAQLSHGHVRTVQGQHSMFLTILSALSVSAHGNTVQHVLSTSESTLLTAHLTARILISVYHMEPSCDVMWAPCACFRLPSGKAQITVPFHQRNCCKLNNFVQQRRLTPTRYRISPDL